VLAELRQKNYAYTPPFAVYPNASDHMTPWQGSSYEPRTNDQMHQTIKESVKNELLAEIEMQQMDRIAQIYGLERSLSDKKLQQKIDDRYRTIDNMKTDIKKDLLALQKMETQRSGDPLIRQISGMLADESQRRGVPFGQLIAGLEQKTGTGSGMMGRISNMLNTGQRRGFMYGVGAMILCSLLLPSARNNMRSIAVRSVEEGISMVERAKSFVNSHYQQNPPTDFANFDPDSPPLGNLPGNGDNLSQ